MRNTTVKKVTVEELEEAHRIAARVVAMYGDTYLPIFKRMHDELIKAKEEDKTKALAMEIAMQYGNR